MYFIRFTIIIVAVFSRSFIFGQVLSPPYSNQNAGTYTEDVILELNHLEEGVSIFYTTNGNDPTVADNLYTGPILLSNREGEPNIYANIPTNPSLTYPYGTYNAIRAETRGWVPPNGSVYKINIIRFKAFKPGYAPSETVTQTFMIDPLGAEKYSFPVVSIAIDQDDIFSNESGYYVYGNHPDGNYTLKGPAWERLLHLEILDNETGEVVLQRAARSRVHGGGSRHAPKKTLRLYGETGDFTNFNYAFFEETELAKFKRILLKGGGHRLDCFPRDDLANSITRGLNVEQQNYRHVIVFINGEYWGIHSAKERMDNYFFQNIFGIDDNDISVLDQEFDLQGGGTPADSAALNNLEDYIVFNDMSVPSFYKHVSDRIDIDNYIDYMCAEIFLSNEDWVYSNVVIWRKSGAFNPSLSSPYNGKFRWAFYDLDGAFGGSCNNAFYTVNTLAAATIEDGIFASYSQMFRNLLESPEFRNRFINRMSDLTNSWFKTSTLKVKIDSIYATLSPEMLENVQRWRYPSTAETLEDRYEETPSLDQWYQMQEYFHLFAERRQRKVREHIMEKWGFPDTNKLTVNVSDMSMGSVQVNSILINPSLPGVSHDVYPWVGDYIDSLTVPLIAVPKPGYRFVEWLGTGIETDTIFWNASGDSTFTAIFEEDAEFKPVLINEVMLSNATNYMDNYGDYDDWLELYNPNSSIMDLSGCTLEKNGTVWTIPNNTKIDANGYLIFWHDKETYQGKDHVNFKLSNQIDTVFLYDANGLEMSQIRYPVIPTDESYGRYPNGSDTFSSFSSPTPNMNNDYAGFSTLEQELKVLFAYPNPTQESVRLSEPVDIELYDLSGRQILYTENTNFIDLSNFKPGIYVLKSEGYQPLKIILAN
jgi:hypothetical protein